MSGIQFVLKLSGLLSFRCLMSLQIPLSTRCSKVESRLAKLKNSKNLSTSTHEPRKPVLLIPSESYISDICRFSTTLTHFPFPPRCRFVHSLKATVIESLTQKLPILIEPLNNIAQLIFILHCFPYHTMLLVAITQFAFLNLLTSLVS